MSGTVSDTSNSSTEQIRLDPCCVFDRYFRDHEDKGKGDRQ